MPQIQSIIFVATREGKIQGTTDPESHVPGLLYPNAFALFDMHGNVSEWVHDAYGEYDVDEYYDPYTAQGTARVIRGGSFDSPPKDLRCANRRSLSPLARNPEIGFRLVRTANSEKSYNCVSKPPPLIQLG